MSEVSAQFPDAAPEEFVDDAGTVEAVEVTLIIASYPSPIAERSYPFASRRSEAFTSERVEGFTARRK